MLKKTLTAAALVAVPVVGVANPAAAEDVVGSDQQIVPVTFTYQGIERNCVLEARTEYRYADNGTTSLEGVTFWRSAFDDPTQSCEDLALLSMVNLNWQTDSGYPEHAESQAPFHNRVHMSILQEGAVTEFTGRHTVQYRCDDTSTNGTCETVVTTSPK